MKMGGLVETAILEAATALETRDEELAEKVRKGDKAIDALEEQINEEAARLIALRAPTASDLRTVLSVIKIAASLERIGDYAKNMAKRAQRARPDDGGRRRGAARSAACPRPWCRCCRTRSTPTSRATWHWPRTCATATATSTRCTTRSFANS